MNKKQLLIWLGTSAAAGAAAGLIANPRHQAMGTAAGVGAGLVAGTAAALIFKRLYGDDGVAYYSSTSPLYETFDDVAG